MAGITHAVRDVDGGADLGRIAGCRSYPGTVEIEIRAGFCDPGGELLAVLDRSGWQRITAWRRGEIADEIVRVCEATERGIAEAWQRRPSSPRFMIGYLHRSLPLSVR
ncbi:MAG: hypothetical protein ACLPTJ_02630 [Solirubrobacteraceae bacterium]